MKTLNVDKLDRIESLGKLEPIDRKVVQKLNNFSEAYKRGTQKSYDSMLKEARSFGGSPGSRFCCVDGFIID